MDAPQAPTGRNPVLSRAQVSDLIAGGQTVIVVDGDVLRLDSWLKYHPGGDKAIKHMVGRDATDEVNALHSAKARRQMRAFRIGRIEGQWENFLPPIQGGKFRLSQSGDAVAAEDASSEPSTPSFEPADDLPSSSSASSCATSAPTSSRRRGGGGSSSSSSSASSASSDDDRAPSSATSLASSTADVKPAGASALSSLRLGYLDARTREQIALDAAKYPPVDAAVQRSIELKYRALDARIRALGLYDCAYAAYAIECVRYAALFAGFVGCLSAGWYAASAALLGIFWHQLVFTAHDAGHMGITHRFDVDTVIGIVIADFLGGLSLGWWKRNHNVHHIVTNSPEHDPDIEHMPFFAISHRFLASLKSTYYDRVMAYDAFAQFLIRYQNYLYYPVMAFGRFNLYRLSWEYLLLGQGPRHGPAWWHRWFELAGQVFFWTWFGYGVLYLSIPTAWDRVVFVLVSHAITMPLHVQITLSHFAMSTSDLGVGESFPQKMLRTTMDVDCPPWLDFLHGGLQFQAIHHLFPRIPRHNLRRTQALVQEFCDDVNIPYALLGFVDGNKEVLSRLGDVGRQAAILAECQRALTLNAVGTS